MKAQLNCSKSCKYWQIYQNSVNLQPVDFDILWKESAEHLFKSSILEEHIFGGLWQDILECSCGKRTENAITKMSEMLPLTCNGENIQQCLDNHFSPHTIERNCLDCKTKTGEKTIVVILEPATLVLQINRYEYNRYEAKAEKNNKKITCPTTINLPSGSFYSLCSIVNHMESSPEEGHYNMLLYNNHTSSYVLLDDTTIHFEYVMDAKMDQIQYLVTYVKI